MALSEHEQRLLAQMEAALAADDPKLATAMRGGRSARRVPWLLVIAGVVLGGVLLVVGLSVHPAVSVAGFLVMFVAVVTGVLGWGRSSASAEPTDAEAFATQSSASGRASSPLSGPGSSSIASPHPPRAPRSRNFMERMEERWRRRQEGDGR